jgi:hypothetical protein
MWLLALAFCNSGRAPITDLESELFEQTLFEGENAESWNFSGCKRVKICRVNHDHACQSTASKTVMLRQEMVTNEIPFHPHVSPVFYQMSNISFVSCIKFHLAHNKHKWACNSIALNAQQGQRRIKEGCVELLITLWGCAGALSTHVSCLSPPSPLFTNVTQDNLQLGQKSPALFHDFLE